METIKLELHPEAIETLRTTLQDRIAVLRAQAFMMEEDINNGRLDSARLGLIADAISDIDDMRTHANDLELTLEQLPK